MPCEPPVTIAVFIVLALVSRWSANAAPRLVPSAARRIGRSADRLEPRRCPESITRNEDGDRLEFQMEPALLPSRGQLSHERRSADSSCRSRFLPRSLKSSTDEFRKLLGHRDGSSTSLRSVPPKRRGALP